MAPKTNDVFLSDGIVEAIVEAIGKLTFHLVELRLRDCPSLCVENIGPEIFAKLLDVVRHNVLALRER